MNQNKINENNQLWNEIQQMAEEDFSLSALNLFGLPACRHYYYNLIKHQDELMPSVGISYWIK